MKSRMTSAFHRRFIFTICAIVLIVCGCTRDKKIATTSPAIVSADHFIAPYDSSRIIRNVYTRIVGSDSTEYFFVTSADSATKKSSLPSTWFDRIEVFTYDSTRKNFISVFLDVIESGNDVQFKDITHDGTEEIIVHRNNGGEDMIAARGLNIYAWQSHRKIETIFLSDDGAPEIQDVDGDKISEVLVSSEYSGIMPQSRTIYYTSTIYSFDGKRFVANNPRYLSYYFSQITAARKDYERVKKRLKKPANAEDFPVYRQFAEWIVWVSASGDLLGAQMLWERERKYLLNTLPQDQFDDLESFISDLDSSERSDDQPMRKSI